MADCLSKLTVKKKDGSYIEVPCGYCLNCRRRRAGYIKRFCEFEQNRYYKLGQGCSFNCLTYSPASLPMTDDGRFTLRKDDYQRFFKRFRKLLDRSLGLDFKYLGCGEYGDHDHLPHYHLILFGLDSGIADRLITKTWTTDARSNTWRPLGRVDCRPLLAGGISYVCDYVMTSLSGDMARQCYDEVGIERPFMTHSKGLGIDYLLSHREDLELNNFTDFFTSRPFVIPKYYRDYYHLGDLDVRPIKASIEASASALGLSVSEYQLQQAYIAERSSVLKSRENLTPVIHNEFTRSLPRDLSYLQSLAFQATDID